MRIAFFTDVYRPTINGVVMSIDSYADELRSQGHEVTIVCPNYSDMSDEDPNIIRVSAVTFPAYKEYRIASPFSRRVDLFMRDYPQDIIHIHSPFSIGLLGIYYAKKKRLPLIYTAHTNYADYRHYVQGVGLFTEKAIDKLASKFSNRVDLTIAPSKKIANGLIYYGTSKKVAVLPTGIPKLPRGVRSRFRKKYSLDRKFIFTYLGRLTKEKNIEFIIHAFSLATPALPAQACLVLVGDGPYRDVLEKYVEDLNIQNKVIFTGFLQGQDRADAFAASDVFCHASHSETQGITLMEASAYGIPLLVNEDDAYRGVAIEGCNAIVVADDDVEYYANQMTVLAGNVEKRNDLGSCGKELSRQFSIEEQTRELIKIYEEVIDDKQQSRRTITGKLPSREFTEKQLTVLHSRTFYLQSGQRSKRKPTIVSLHGFLSDSKSLVPSLAELRYGGRLLVPDLPGFGVSGSLKEVPDHVTIEDFCDWLDAYLQKTVKIDEPIIILGYSFGAYIATKYLASSRSKRFNIQRCLLITPVVSIQPQVEFYTGNFLKLASVSETMAANAWRMQHNFTTLYLSKSYRVRTKLKLIKQRKAELKFFNPGLVRNLFLQIREISLEKSVCLIEVPIDVLLAGKDNIAQNNATRELMSHTCDIEVSWYNIPQAGHLAPMEDHTEVAKKIDHVAKDVVSHLSRDSKVASFFRHLNRS